MKILTLLFIAIGSIVGGSYYKSQPEPKTYIKLIACPKPEVCIYEFTYKGETTLMAVSEYKYNVELLNK